MSNLSRTVTVAIALIVSIGSASLSLAQDHQRSPGGMMGAGMMQRGEGQQTDDGRMMGGGGPGMGGSGMDECMMMRGGMGSGVMGGQMGRGMMMRPGMMGSGMMHDGGSPGMGTLFGSRVRPVMNLSVDDVRGYLAMRLERLNNKRLRIGDVKSDDATITADIVTVDNSLVQQLKVDRHTGTIDYVN